MESKYNPFENRYPNRSKIIYDLDNYSESLIKEYNSKKFTKNVDSLSVKNKKLYLFINNQRETNFPEKLSYYKQIPKTIQNNLNIMELETLTPIQKLFFGYLFNHGNKSFDKNNKNNNYDLVGYAQTGSGKTLAYLIPSVSFLFNDPEGKTQIIKSNSLGFVSYPLILIILPTRELAIQTIKKH